MNDASLIALCFQWKLDVSGPAATPHPLSHARSRGTRSSSSTVSISLECTRFPPQMTVQPSQQLWLETHNIPLENSGGTEAFHCFLSVIVVPPRTPPTLLQTQQSFMEYNKVQLQLTCHLSPSPSLHKLSFGEQLRVHFATRQQQRRKNKQQIFHWWSQREGCLLSYHAQNWCRGCSSELISTTKTTGRMQPCSTKVNLGGTYKLQTPHLMSPRNTCHGGWRAPGFPWI